MAKKVAYEIDYTSASGERLIHYVKSYFKGETVYADIHKRIGKNVIIHSVTQLKAKPEL